MSRWIGVDLDGTLAKWDCGWEEDPRTIGEPIPAMVDRVREWLAAGRVVKIMTARCDPRWRKPNGEVVMLTPEAHWSIFEAIHDWCKEHLGQALEVTDTKDYEMEALYDDRAIAVERDTGRILGGSEVRCG